MGTEPSSEFFHIPATSLSRPVRDATLGLGAAFAVLDSLVILSSGLSAYASRNVVGDLLGVSSVDLSSLSHVPLLGVLVTYAILTVVCNAAHDLYSEEALKSPRVENFKLIEGFLISTLLAIMVVFVAGQKGVPRLIFVNTAVFGLAGLVALRYAVRFVYLRRVARGIGNQHVLVVGSGPVARAFREHLETHRHLGKAFCGFVDETANSTASQLGTLQELPRILKEYFIDEIFLTPGISRELAMEIVLEARRQRIGVKVVPDVYGGLAIGATVSYMGGVPVIELNRQPIPALGLFVKRLMDLVIAFAMLLATSPLLLITAILIKIDSPGPVFYAAWRVGRKGRKFLCYKFRTMVADADAHKERLRHMNERNGATFKIANDPRVTRLGRFLRKYSIDEFPQLYNVLKGEMSVVGPRPHPVDDYNQYGIEDLRRLDVLPGITGLWQVSARHDPSFEKNVSLDLEYIQNWNIALDVRILIKTVPEVLRGTGR